MVSGWRATIVAVLVVGITLLHYGTNLQAGPVHEFLARAYYIPVVLAGLWFGAPGGLLTAFAASVIYLPHAFHGWHGPHSFFFRFLEIVMYHIIGGLTGILAARVQKALEGEQRARQERERAYERLRERTEELFTVEEQLRRADRLAALGRLSAGLAHEIRNPLATIRTSAEFLHEERTDPRDAGAEGEGSGRPDFTRVLLEETERLDRIVTDFLDFARQEGSSNGEDGTAPVADTVGKVVQFLERPLAKRGIQARLDLPDDDALVAVPESQLRQVLLNLLLNAMDAVGEGGWIAVEVRQDASRTVTIVVEDSGPGVPPELAKSIFDPFFSTKEGGTGLGLSIVDRILASHGGEIVLEQSGEPSSRFRVRVPLAGT